jgi:hypothetical protein
MSGCYGSSQEDRMREAELHRFLASQDDYDAAEAIAEDIKAKAVSPKYAAALVSDYECMLDRMPELIAAACRADDMRAFGAQVMQMVTDEIKRVAEFQENCDA